MNQLDMVVVHDLKNTLYNIATRLEQKENVGPHVKQEITLINNGARKLTNLLLLNKYDNDEFDVQLDSESPLEMVEELIGNFTVMYPNIEVTLDNQGCPDIWFFDKYYVELAVNNGLHNAAQFTKTKIDIRLFENENGVNIEIEDDGDGFTDRVLEMFKNNQEMTASERGTGLGLALARTIAAKHTNKSKAGQVFIRNNKETKGAIFTFVLP